MALIKADRVKETSTSTSTGNFTLDGAPTGFRTFASVCAVNDTVFYVIDSDSGSEWETGLGTYSATNTLTRTTVYASSNGGSVVAFSAGTKNVYISLTARQIDTISAAPKASTGSPPLLERLVGAAHTALTASTEYNDIYWVLARAVQFSTGAVATQRAIRIAAPTYSFVGASVITDAATMQIDGAPLAGTNATVTRQIGLKIVSNSANCTTLALQLNVSQSSTSRLFEVYDSTGLPADSDNRAAISGNGKFTTYKDTGSNSGQGLGEAFGTGCTAAYHTACAFGLNGYASGYGATAVGNGTQANASNSIAIGSFARADNPNSISIGASVVNQTTNSIAIGSTSNTLNAFYGTLRTYMPSATTTGAIIRGFASQSANLQEWQDSAGNVLASIGANGSPQYPSSNPSGYAANQNDLVLTGSAFQRLSGTAARDITGVAPPSGLSHVDGRTLRIFNVGSFNLTLKHNSASSTAANRFYCIGAVDIIISAGDYAELIYDSNNNGSAAAGWRVY